MLLCPFHGTLPTGMSLELERVERRKFWWISFLDNPSLIFFTMISLACRERLASASADKTIKLWNVTTQTNEATFTHHTDKVHSIPQCDVIFVFRVS